MMFDLFIVATITDNGGELKQPIFQTISLKYDSISPPPVLITFYPL